MHMGRKSKIGALLLGAGAVAGGVIAVRHYRRTKSFAGSWDLRRHSDTLRAKLRRIPPFAAVKLIWSITDAGWPMDLGRFEMSGPYGVAVHFDLSDGCKVSMVPTNDGQSFRMISYEHPKVPGYGPHRVPDELNVEGLTFGHFQQIAARLARTSDL
jgi:hypothetical protein